MVLRGENGGVLIILLYCMMMGLLEVSNGEVHKVGEAAGWTTIGNVNYKDWAANKTFRLNDSVVFEYNPQFHNVMQVTHAEYRACNVSSPILTYTTGNDTITIKTYGHHFFLCGVPGHCQAGQRVDIHVIAPSPPPGGGANSPLSQLVPSPVPPVTGSPVSRSDVARPSNEPRYGKLVGWVVLQALLVFGLGR